MTISHHITRRSLLSGISAAAGLSLIGCGGTQTSDSVAFGNGAMNETAPARQAAAMTVYRDPSCGCCEAWAELARDAGYQVRLIDEPDMPAIKRQHGVPNELLSCHTTIIGGFAVEGHVPLRDVDRLLKERPAGVKGLAVPGMPRGSPGMEMPDGSRDRFDVLAFDAAGRTSVFSAA